MNVEAIIALVDRAVYNQTEKHLSDLQQTVIIKVLQGKKYHEIAQEYGCTEGHAKDTGSLLWQLLSTAWGKKITKSNFGSSSNMQLQSVNNSQIDSNYSTGDSANLAVLASSHFLGRHQAMAALHNSIARNQKIIVIQGEGGVGKTTLAQNFLASQKFDLVLEVLMAKETENIISVASIVEEWLQRDLNEDSGREFGINLARFKRCLEQHRVGILIDNLEPALDKDGRLIDKHRNYIELLRILADSKVRSTTIITSRDRLCEPEIDLEHYRLSGLDLASWKQYFVANKIHFCDRLLTSIHNIYAGNAKAMGIVCGVVSEDYEGEVEQYWQENCHDPLVETDLKNLIGSQFNRLQKLDPQAYILLCRLGCYRYQDVPKISQSGLFCLLWDVAAREQRRIIKSLRNRSLIEFARGEYWLHPVVREEAKSRLQRSLEQWQQTHRQIAAFLTHNVGKINNIQAGMTALEAYYHYKAIQDYAAAAKVILHSRENQWGQFLTLGTTLYRLGIIQQLQKAIEAIIELVEHDRYRSELNNILGDLYWTTGKVYQAIACQQKTIVTSQSCQQLIPLDREHKHDLYYWRMLEVDSLLSLGLYNIDLWELATARKLFQQVVDLAHNTNHHAWSIKAAVGLALINSHQKTSRFSQSVVTDLYNSIVNLKDPAYNTGRFAYFMQILGQILFNYRQIEPAKTMWQKAIAFSQLSHYTQIEAKSWLGLGRIKRYLGELQQAQRYHQRATQLLDKINAKCDLAESHFQWGLTLQANRQDDDAKQHFKIAIELYRQIPAPKQIQKIESYLQKI